MIKFTFFTIQNDFPYEQLKKPLEFNEDPHGLTNWVMKLPLSIYSADLSEKHTFSQETVTLVSNNGVLADQKWKYFVITQKDGTRLYCTSQVFYQKGYLSNPKRLINQLATSSLQNRCFYLPQCLILMSNQPYFKIHVNLLKIYEQIQRQKSQLNHPVSPKQIQRYLTLSSQSLDDLIQVKQNLGTKQPKIWTIFDYYLSKCNQHRAGETVLMQKRTNLPVLHLFNLKAEKIFQISHFFNLPFSSKTISDVITAILLQKQIIVTSKCNNLTVIVIESFLQLIKPLKWEHMLIHNLPTHLLEVADQNFMPFMVGINKDQIQELNWSSKFILFVEQDRFFKPNKLPTPGFILQQFNEKLLPSVSNSYNQKNVLKQSIALMCRLLEPLIKLKGQNVTHQGSFYRQFVITSLYQTFKDKIDQPELSEFNHLISIKDIQERQRSIQRQLNTACYYFQNPKIVYNQTQWIKYYISHNNPKMNQSRRQENNKMPSLRELQQNMISEAKHKKMIRRVATMKQQSTSHQGNYKLSRGIQKIKVSTKKQEHFQPFFMQLLQQRLGMSPTHF